MQLVLKVYPSLCATSKFTINGVRANSNDFGTQADRNPEEAEDYACADMQFERIPSTKKHSC